MRIFELPCLDSRKSFYGKAHVIEHDNGTKQLKSYNTIVAEIDNTGNYNKLWNGNTQTTNRHIRSFKLFYNLEV
jgi:hypothetical protein